MANTFKTLLTDLGEAAVDFSTLTVTTATGDFQAALKGQNIELDNVDMEALFKKAAVEDVDGKLIIAAIDSYKLDGDAFVFRTNSEQVSPELREDLEVAHAGAVEAGQALRDGIFSMVKDGIANLVK
jgi:hypothetical protein